MNSKLTFINWLKRIFTVQTIAVIVAIASLVVGIMSYSSNLHGEIKLAIKGVELSPKIDHFKCLVFVQDSNVYLDGCHFLIDDSISQSKLSYGAILPEIKNKSKNAVVNLQYKILIHSSGGLKKAVVHKDFDGQQRDGFAFSELEYKNDILPAHTCLPAPFTNLKLTDEQSNCEIVYSLSYEGIKRPMIFRVELYMVQVDHLDATIYNGYRNSFLQIVRENRDDAEKMCVTIGDSIISNVEIFK